MTTRAHAIFYAAPVSHDPHAPTGPRSPRDRPPDPAASARREPALGWLGDLRFERDQPQGRNQHSRTREAAWRQWPRWAWWSLAAVALALAVVLMFRRPLADRLWPETKAQALREQAAQALVRGHLTAADGSGARELYEAVLAIEPDRSEARAGLAQVAQAALAQARAALAANRFADAHRALRLARSLSVPRAQADAVATRLREREAAHAGIDRLLLQAAAARKKGQLTGAADAALPLYRRVLALQPERVQALEGREDALADLLQRAQSQLQDGELVAAATTIDAARGFDPGHADLPAAESSLARALEQALQDADAQLRFGRLERAAAGYRVLLQLDAGNQDAARGLARVASAWAQRAERFAADFRFAEADQALRQARALAPRGATLEASERHVARAKQAQARLGSPLPAGERAQRVQRLLAGAAAAEARGDLLAPPGDSAFDKLRVARAIAPDDPAVRRAAARMLPAAADCFERELRGNNLGRARACLDALVVLESDAGKLRSARRRLATRWLAIGDERLTAGELQAASHALDTARNIDPATPGLRDFADRLRVATASGD